MKTVPLSRSFTGQCKIQIPESRLSSADISLMTSALYPQKNSFSCTQTSKNLKVIIIILKTLLTISDTLGFIMIVASCDLENGSFLTCAQDRSFQQVLNGGLFFSGMYHPLMYHTLMFSNTKCIKFQIGSIDFSFKVSTFCYEIHRWMLSCLF